MPVQKTKASELLGKALEAKHNWENTKLRLEKATTEHAYAERSLVLARRELELERSRIAPDDDWYQEMTQGWAYADEMIAELDSIELVGQPIGEAARSALRQLRKESIDRLVAHMRARGFQFTTDYPARELHGALVKQPWAKKNAKTDQWEYVI